MLYYHRRLTGDNPIYFTVKSELCKINEFQCDDETCVPREMKCNGENDCPDSSDESFGNCGKFFVHILFPTHNHLSPVSYT